MRNRFVPLMAIIMVTIGLSGCHMADLPLLSHDRGAGDHAMMSERQADVAQKGAEVMPFDLNATTHIFEKTDDGGIQQVIADDPAETEQIALIRTHLAEEAARFQQGDFHDPAMIHGDDMAGLHELMMGATQMEITYSDLPDGAQIVYATADAELINALHNWFDAQVADHGAHATDQR